MISNTICSHLKLAEQAGLDEYKKTFQLNTSASSKVKTIKNKINDYKYISATKLSKEQRQSTNPFVFYSKNGVVNTISNTTSNECTGIIIQKSSDNFVNNSNSQSSECFDYDLCSYYNSRQEKDLTKRVFKSVRKECTLNDFSKMSGCKAISLGHGINKSVAENSFSNVKTTSFNNKSSNSVREEKPMCRTKDQEHAFRQIEDVHNYSKLNIYGYCSLEKSRFENRHSYSSYRNNQDENGHVNGEDKDDEDFNIVNYDRFGEIVKLSETTQYTERNTNNVLLKTENTGNITSPDRQTRRPMNAFLIFCKRHRGIVKDKYKNYENRSITKILGEWWASLDANNKKCYVNLAKQNKDAFFSANPNFKWYKLPAPSLRPLTTRPRNIERSENQSELGDLTTQNNHISTCDMSRSTETKNVSYFKLADEKQMGRLNNLMYANTASTSKKDVLQKPLSEGSNCFHSSCNRKSDISCEYSLNFNRSYSYKSCSTSEDDLIQRKSARSCKGKKYQDLINSGQISAVTSKKKNTSLKTSTKFNNNERSQYLVMHMNKGRQVKNSSKKQALSPKHEAISKTDNGRWVMTHYQDSYGFQKRQYDFVSFDLENKIRRLPAQCLETYLQRKKNMKFKKKFNSKKRSLQQTKLKDCSLEQQVKFSLNQPKIALETKEQIVGSQKRKARKESITRRDITSLQNDVQVFLGSSYVTSAFVVGRRSPKTQVLATVNQNNTSDLLILAELAGNLTETAQ